MKKGMMVVTIVAALSFFASVIAVAQSGAAEATKATKQQPKKKETLSDSSAVTKPHKPKFWELEVDHCIVNNLDPCKHTISVKQGALTGQCFYKVKTPPINDITKDDADFWGKGKSYTIRVSMIRPVSLGGQAGAIKEDVIMTPQFTWGDVLTWKRSGLGNTSKTWKWMLPFAWNIEGAYGEVLLYSFEFNVDSKNDINENDEKNNDCYGKILVYYQ